MDPKIKAIGIIFLLVVIGLILGVVISQLSISYASDKLSERYGELNQRIQMLINAFKDMYILATSIICINILLLLGLLGIYVDSFRKTKSSFLFGLLLFIGVLFIQSVLSLPILQSTLGFGGYDMSLIGVLPNLFETIALVILLYLSME